MNGSQKVRYGDVVGVDRGCSQHYGIYIGDDKIVHYTTLVGDESGTHIIHITDQERFLAKDSTYFVCDFSFIMKNLKRCEMLYSHRWEIKQLINPKIDFSIQSNFNKRLYEGFANKEYNLYSPKETVERAYSRLGECITSDGESNYEHFAIWCKTGITRPGDANALLKYIKKESNGGEVHVKN